MRSINRIDGEDIVRGATLLGTGGGGDPKKGFTFVQEIKEVTLVSLDELDNDDYVFCAFVVGSSGAVYKPSTSMLIAYEYFSKRFSGKLKAIIPVEIGGGGLGESLRLANKFGLPLVDADIVGYRAAPEVFLETITLANLSRTPLYVANDNGDVACLESSTDYVFIEKFLRNFALISGGSVYVCGYPLLVKDLKLLGISGSVSFSLELGKLMRTKNYEQVAKSFTVLGEGKVKEVSLASEDGFLKGKSCIEIGGEAYTILVKNENIVCKKNGIPIVTSPDLICIYDLDKNEAVYNRDISVGLRVAVLARAAIPLWRTIEGQKLFSPKQLGFTEDTVLLDSGKEGFPQKEETQ